MENWLYDKTTMNLVSGHYRTNETLPDELFQQVCKGSTVCFSSVLLTGLFLFKSLVILLMLLLFIQNISPFLIGFQSPANSS